ncbi:LytTR family DNA-binding domain-containing protein [Mucilaginibacter sp. dw_454]|uniref:LytR/AlgR family response regulator transcription factor n=1 Tax=Mucilaginibacter sp. dw_454 TaxID=2720079 RepID=UPI001BD234FC|nr:LytTR family DNA-binding domain-containing protein [Mucilaginibacter sp. dw_454]
MNCIIIDDEPLALELLEDNIRMVDGLELVGSFQSAMAATNLLQQQTIDLIFCDIQMPGINGLQFVKSLTNKPLIIFVTAYDQFALDGFELDVVDYLLKPVATERFLKACNKAKTIFEQSKRSAGTELEKRRKYIFLYADYNLVKLNHEDITYIEGLKDYVKIYLANAPKPIISRVTIKSLESQLPADDFFRIHKSYIVNLDHVHSIRKGRVKVGDAEVPVSDGYKEVIDKMTGRLD